MFFLRGVFNVCFFIKFLKQKNVVVLKRGFSSIRAASLKRGVLFLKKRLLSKSRFPVKRMVFFFFKGCVFPKFFFFSKVFFQGLLFSHSFVLGFIFSNVFVSNVYFSIFQRFFKEVFC